MLERTTTTMQLFNIFVTGAHAAGKSQFIHTSRKLEDALLRPYLPSKVSVERQRIEFSLDHTSVSIDNNTIVDICKLNDEIFDPNYLFDREISCLGYVVLFDSCRPVHFVETLRLLQQLTMLTNAPFIVAATKQDDPAAIPLSYIRERLNLASQIPLVPCVTTDLESVKQILLSLLEHIEHRT